MCVYLYVVYTCVYMSILARIYMNVSVYVLMYVRVHSTLPALSCLKILEACSKKLFVSLSDCFPNRVVCNMMTLDSH